MVGLGKLWNSQGTGIPDRYQVVVATSSKLSTIGAPFQTTNFGGVRNQLSNFVLSDANIVVVDKATSCTSGKSVLVPSHYTNTSIVSVHASKLGTFFDIPDLNFSGTETNTDICSITGPLDTANIGIWASFKKRADSTRLGRPDIYIAFKTNCNLIVGAPVKEVQVVIVDETRCI